MTDNIIEKLRTKIKPIVKIYQIEHSQYCIACFNKRLGHNVKIFIQLYEGVFNSMNFFLCNECIERIINENE